MYQNKLYEKMKKDLYEKCEISVALSKSTIILIFCYNPYTMQNYACSWLNTSSTIQFDKLGIKVTTNDYTI